MKSFLLVALVVVLAVAQGSEAASLVKRDLQTDVETFARFLSDLSSSAAKLNLKELEEKFSQANQLDRLAHVGPALRKMKADAEELPQLLGRFSPDAQDKVQQMVDGIDAHLTPLVDLAEQVVHQVIENNKDQVPEQ